MYNILFLAHSSTRYLVLGSVLLVFVLSVYGLFAKKPFGVLNDKASLYMLIFTHIQLVLGLVVYFGSPLVQFSAGTMKDKVLRYWTVEHGFMMLIAIALITIARISIKRMPTPAAKHRRLMIFTGVALLVIVSAIIHSGRPLL